MESLNLKLDNIVTISGQIELLSGLHIGTGDSGLHIGGTDSPVIKNPHSNLPYIPGSSLKGKMRSLLEWYFGVVGLTGGKPLSLANVESMSEAQQENGRSLLKVFGLAGDADLTSNDKKQGMGITRISVADSNLNQQYQQWVENAGLQQTEVKFENTINRLSGTADNPRNFERVPAGAKFDLHLSIKVLSCDDQQKLEEILLTALRLLEMDALGGSGSRGYGRVKFHLKGDLQARLDAIQPFGDVA